MCRRFQFAVLPVMALVITLIALRAGFAQGDGAKSPIKTSWDLTPYRVEICVAVEPSARLPLSLEAELLQQLVAQAEASFGGPWVVSPGKQALMSRSRLLRKLALPDEIPALKPGSDIDKLIVIGVQEQASAIQVTAREFDVAANLWNSPVQRPVMQLSRLPVEAFAALQAAWGPVLRIDNVDKETVSVTMRAGSLPKRDGSYLAIDRSLPFSVHILQADKDGRTKADTITPLPWTYLLPISTPGAATGASRATFKCRLHTALSGSPIPAFHPLQPRLAIGLPKSAASTRLVLVDQESPQPPLEGYEVFLAPIESTASSAGPQKIGVTERSGEVEIPAGDGTLRRLIISHGGEELLRRPFLPGRKGEERLALPSDRRRLELAAEIAAAEDELTDTLGRLAVLGARSQEALAKRNLSDLNRIAAEMKNAASLTTLTDRIAALESKLASADETTRSRLAPVVAQFKANVEALQAKAAGAP